MKEPKDTPKESPKSEAPATPDIAAMLAKMQEQLNAQAQEMATLKDTNQGLIEELAKKNEAHAKDVAAQAAALATRGFSGQYDDVHENIREDDVSTDPRIRKPKRIAEVAVQVHKTINGELHSAEAKRTIKYW